ncbi:MAG: hypothetical protein QM490_01685 [Candidatus Gracilibacteria bacterium]
MRINHKIEIGKKEFSVDKNCVLGRDYYRQLLDIRNSTRREIINNLKGVFYSVEPERDSMIGKILQVIEEPLKNSFDACKDNYFKNRDFVGIIIITLVVNTKRQVLTIIINDNGAGLDSVDSSVKNNNKEYIGGDGIGLDPITKNRTDFLRLEMDHNGASILLRIKY